MFTITCYGPQLNYRCVVVAPHKDQYILSPKYVLVIKFCTILLLLSFFLRDFLNLFTYIREYKRVQFLLQNKRREKGCYFDSVGLRLSFKVFQQKLQKRKNVDMANPAFLPLWLHFINSNWVIQVHNTVNLVVTLNCCSLNCRK